MTTPKAYQVNNAGSRGRSTEQVRLTFAGQIAARLRRYQAESTTLSWPSPKYRQDPVGFFWDILGAYPWFEQRRILRAMRDKQRVSVASGHKVSKSHTIGGGSLWFYCSWDDARAVMTSTTARQVDDILWREVRMMHARSGRCFTCKAKNEGQRALCERVRELLTADVDCSPEDVITAELECGPWDALAWIYGTETPKPKDRERLLKAYGIDRQAWDKVRDLEQVPRPCPHSALIDGELNETARTGLKSGFRSVTGFTAREAEAVAGISGTALRYFVDEASGVPQIIYEAIEGNRAGGAAIALFGNPTKNTGEHYDSLNSKASFYEGIRISSEDTPNAQAKRVIVPGLCEWDFVKEKREEWGEDSAQYQVRVKGEHAEKEEGRIFPLAFIAESTQRWYDAPGTGRLVLGVDPAGDSGTGDETVIYPRRGDKAFDPFVGRGLDADGHVAQIQRMIIGMREATELPLVVVDGEGPIGAKVVTALRAASSDRACRFELMVVRSSDGARRKPREHERLRDELAANLHEWMRDGGVPEDAKLEQELHCLRWEVTLKGKWKLVSKRDIRKEIGRSPDRYDALALAVWEQLAQDVPGAAGDENDDRGPDVPKSLDPYGAEDFENNSIDPYG